MTKHVLFTLLALAACGDDRPGTSAVTPGTPATLVPVGEGDAGTSGDGGASCDAVATVDAAPIAESFVNAATPPDPLGGTVPSGRFVLTSIARFQAWSTERDEDENFVEPPPTSDLLEAKTLVVEGAQYRFATRTGTIAAGVGSDVTIRGGALSPRGATMVLAQQCPETGALALGYSVIGDTISIYTSPTRRETFSPAP